MLKVNFYKLNEIKDNNLMFAVIAARHEKKWVFVRHKQRITWEIPGGHREVDESIDLTASRELTEETGAKEFIIVPVCIYSVEKDGKESFGQLFYAEIERFDELVDSEIGEIIMLDKMPESLTYPLIQPYLFSKVKEFFCYYYDCTSIYSWTT